MFYSSTRGIDKNKRFKEILLNGLAKDGGLYIPESLKKFSCTELKCLRGLNYPELAFEVTKDFISSDIPHDKYKEICYKTYSKVFGKHIISFNKLSNNEYIANLFHGPTFAFKDFALQLLGNIYDFILKEEEKKLTIIGATSGDTGSAAIYGCSQSEKIKIFILFPKGKVSEIQRRQMTTFNKSNVFNIAVNGNFDDCQKLVKDFFNINNKKKEVNLAAVNSINWVRIMGQLVYYFWSFFRVSNDLNPISFVVPTGNFGNAYAGFISKKMGLPIEKIVVGSNKNDILTRFFKSGKMLIKKPKKTLSPSMDIQVSSNFERLLFEYIADGKMISKYFKKLETNGEFEVCSENLERMKCIFKSGKLNDEKTKETIKFIKDKYNIILDPHTAVGIAVGKKELSNQDKRVYLATAHYGKFLDTINLSLCKKIKYPVKLEKLTKKKEKYYEIDNKLEEFRSFVLKNN